jgi:hypothetical protein
MASRLLKNWRILPGQFSFGATRFITQSSDAFAAFYLEVRQALRLAVGEITSQSFGTGENAFVERIKEVLVPRASQLGVELINVEVYEAVPVWRPHASA